MTNRRLIAMIQGRAAAGDPLDLSLAAQPKIVSALSRLTFVVGAAGVAVVAAASLGGGLVSLAADAAVGGGGTATAGPARSANVAGLAASDPVQVEVQGIGGADGGPDSTLPARRTPAVLQGIVAPGPGQPVQPPAPTTTLPAPTVARIAVGPATPPAPPAPGSVEAVIIEVFGAHGQEAIGVARCESHLNPGAISRNGANWGLFQINSAHRQRVARMGFRWEDLLDARVNALVAKSIFDEQGWRPWACRGAAH